MVDIVMITDDNYVKPTVVAITSCVQSKAQSSKYSIYVLGNKLSRKSINLIKSCEKDGVSIFIINQEKIIRKLPKIKMHRHVTTSALLKFFLSDIFPEKDRVLYLDGDILVQQDLSELFNTDLQDNYAGVVKDTLSVVYPDYMMNTGILNKYYFNSGVLLLNIPKLREDNIKEKLLKFKEEVDSMFMDQDAFNVVIGNNVKYLPYKYNFLNYYLEVMTPSELSRFFGEELPMEHTEIYKNCVILHLGGKEKPWKYDLGYLSNLYKEYWENSPIKEDFPTLLDVNSIVKEMNYNFIEKIFSIKNNGTYKVITILGLSFKIKRKNG